MAAVSNPQLLRPGQTKSSICILPPGARNRHKAKLDAPTLTGIDVTLSFSIHECSTLAFKCPVHVFLSQAGIDNGRCAHALADWCPWLVSLAKPLQRAIGWNNQLMRELCRVWWWSSRLAAAEKEEQQKQAEVGLLLVDNVQGLDVVPHRVPRLAWFQCVKFRG
eukprot:scaffold12289_cov19-Tisochrysis_lutea.AAC.1